MKNLEKLDLINVIGRELQSRMTFTEIDAYFDTYGIPTNHQPSSNSKWVYVKEVLPKIDDKIVIEIANELGIQHSVLSPTPVVTDEDATFWKPGHFKLFISHLASFKKTISILKKELEKFGISSFVAHEDIEPTKEWQDEIEKGLFSMDALCAVLMPGFKDSNWTDQEVGVAIGRGILVIPIRRELDPYGFIGKYQGFQSMGKNIGEVARGIFSIIFTNPKTKNKIEQILSELFLLSNSPEEARQRLAAIKMINNFPKDKVNAIHLGISQNMNLKNPPLLKEFNSFSNKYGLNPIELKDFVDTRTEKLDDDLPF